MLYKSLFFAKNKSEMQANPELRNNNKRLAYLQVYNVCGLGIGEDYLKQQKLS